MTGKRSFLSVAKLTCYNFSPWIGEIYLYSSWTIVSLCTRNRSTCHMAGECIKIFALWNQPKPRRTQKFLSMERKSFPFTFRKDIDFGVCLITSHFTKIFKIFGWFSSIFIFKYTLKWWTDNDNFVSSFLIFVSYLFFLSYCIGISF